jgi:hypothetical protein
MAILTILCLPVTLAAVFAAAVTAQPIEQVLLSRAAMTSIEVVARAVAMLMALGIVDFTYRVWSTLRDPAVGALAALSVVGIAPWAYYGKVGNVDVPAIFWMCLALEQVIILQVHREFSVSRERAALVFTTLAVLTKDQIAGALVLPIAWLAVAPGIGMTQAPASRGPGALSSSDASAVEWSSLGRAFRGSLWRSVALCLGLYVIVSGALVNPTGWLARVRFILGPASRDWVEFEPTFAGRMALMRDIFFRVPELTSWPSALLSALGIGVCVLDAKRRTQLLPAAAALSFTATFNVLALRSEHRFLLVQAVLLAPYSALVVPAMARFSAAWWAGHGAFFVACLANLRSVASLDATLIFDSRYSAETFLSTLPTHSRVEIMGGPKFFPRFPEGLDLTRVGLDPLDARRAIPGVKEELGDPRAIGLRRPDYLVLSEEFATPQFFPTGVRRGAYMEPSTLDFFHQLDREQTSYTLAYRAKCHLPWPLTCTRLHFCTGGDIAIYKRRDASMRHP